MAAIRLDKFIAESAGMTRSQARDAVRQGRATVSGQTERRPERKLDPETEPVCLDGACLSRAGELYLMLHKPRGVVCATEDRREKTVLDLLPRELQDCGLFPVGRLDKDTTGLLLLTTDGDFAHRVISPRRHVEKRYLAETEGTPDESDAAAFAAGLTLGDGTRCREAKLEILGEGRCAVTVTEGMYHQVRRMLAACGKPVLALHRVSIGALCLDEDLAPGDHRPLTEAERAAVLGQTLEK